MRDAVTIAEIEVCRARRETMWTGNSYRKFGSMMYVIFFAAVVIPMLLVLGGLLLWRSISALDRRRSPVRVQLMNLPGEGLRRRIAKLDQQLSEFSTLMAVSGPIFLSLWLLLRISKTGLDWTRIRFGGGDLLFAGALLCLVTWIVWRMIHHIKARRRAVDGLRAELTVAQSLAPLTAEGAMVFHDVPGEGYNLDHVVVAQGAVFAVETKSRRKPAASGSASARVRYDNRQLFFPNGADEKSVEQAAYQAKWLEKYLRDGGIQNVRVIPVLALPGWYVERTNPEVRAPVLVNNCSNSTFMMHEKFGAPIPDTVRKYIARLIMLRYPAAPETNA